jgi:hypothetical protein
MMCTLSSVHCLAVAQGLVIIGEATILDLVLSSLGAWTVNHRWNASELDDDDQQAILPSAKSNKTIIEHLLLADFESLEQNRR